MTEVLPRSAWTSWEPNRSLLARLFRPAGFAVHWPGTSTPHLSSDRRAVAALLRGELDYHVHGHGWTDIAYQAAIDNAGRIWDLRGIGYRSAANGNVRVNTRYGAVTCLLGKNQEPSVAMLEALRHFRENIWLKRFPKALKVVGHRDLYRTDCPGPRLYRRVRDGSLLERVAEPSPTAAPTVEEYDVATKVVKVEAKPGKDGKANALAGYWVVWPGAVDLMAKKIPGPYSDAEDEIAKFGDGGLLRCDAQQFKALYTIA